MVSGFRHDIFAFVFEVEKSARCFETRICCKSKTAAQHHIACAIFGRAHFVVSCLQQ